MWLLRAYCNFAVKVVHEPTHPWPSAFNSKILSKKLCVDPPTNITPFPSGLGANTWLKISYGSSGPVKSMTGCIGQVCGQLYP